MWYKGWSSLTRVALRMIISGLVMLVASGAAAQHWNAIASFGQANLTPYFLNEQYGFVYNSPVDAGTGGCPVDTLAVYRTVDGETNFTTTIPFTTSATGVATIRIADEKGNIVLTEDEDMTYIGTHFFYFTGTELPSGTYYYQIEFPKGVVIVNRSMLLVK